jgi:hypothetical protein
LRSAGGSPASGGLLGGFVVEGLEFHALYRTHLVGARLRRAGPPVPTGGLRDLVGVDGVAKPAGQRRRGRQQRPAVPAGPVVPFPLALFALPAAFEASP